MTQRERLAAVARAGLRRMEAKRDLNRILHRRDLAAFPELVETLRDEDLRPVFREVTRLLESEASSGPEARDWQAIAAVLVGAIAHFWLIRDAMGSHPGEVDEDRYVAAWVEIARDLLGVELVSSSALRMDHERPGQAD